jgi:hypothetical protein
MIGVNARRASMATQAEMVAQQLDNDGSRFRTQDGTSLDELCEAARARVVSRTSHGTRYVFPDGSVIVAMGGGWDIGLSPDCDCWEGADSGRHHEGCRLAETQP